MASLVSLRAGHGGEEQPVQVAPRKLRSRGDLPHGLHDGVVLESGTGILVNSANEHAWTTSDVCLQLGVISELPRSRVRTVEGGARSVLGVDAEEHE